MSIKKLAAICAFYNRICNSNIIISLASDDEEINPNSENQLSTNSEAIVPIPTVSTMSESIDSSNSIKIPNSTEVLTEEDIKTISKFKPALGDEFWIKFLEMAIKICPTKNRIDIMKVADLMAQVIRGESAFNPHAVAMSLITEKRRISVPIAKGLAQMIKSTAIKPALMTAEQWDILDKPEGLSAIEQLPYIYNLFKTYGIKASMKKEDIHAKNFGGYYNQPRGPHGEEIAYAGAAYTSQSGQTHPQAEFQDKAYNTNIGLDITIDPNTGKALIGPDGNPVRKGFISKNDLSAEAGKARAIMNQEIAKRKAEEKKAANNK
ncbi:MAG: transglycosylase SLT domain-containing protein [Bacteroidales bacterium]